MLELLSITLINIMLVAVAVGIHYEMLYQASRMIHRWCRHHRQRILIGVFIALGAHTLEVWLFAFGYWLMHHQGGLGQLIGNFDGSLLDATYFSFTSYTTLGLGDIEPTGLLRHTVGLEALTGLVLITWTASFLFVEMQRYWNDSR